MWWCVLRTASITHYLSPSQQIISSYLNLALIKGEFFVCKSSPPVRTRMFSGFSICAFWFSQTNCLTFQFLPYPRKQSPIAESPRPLYKLSVFEERSSFPSKSCVLCLCLQTQNRRGNGKENHSVCVCRGRGMRSICVEARERILQHFLWWSLL